MTLRRSWITGWIAALLVGGLAGWGAVGCGGPGGADAGAPDLAEQARQALARWDAAVAAAGGQRFVPVGEQTGLIGTWEPNFDGKAPSLAGKVIAVATLPAAPAPSVQVRWDDGTTATFPAGSAGETLTHMARTGVSCGDCAPLEITGARLTTGRVPTTRGMAEAPVWEYTVRGTAVRFTRVAVAPRAQVTVTPPPWDPYDSPGGLPIDRAAMAAGARRMTVDFTGAPEPASRPCGADYTARAVESANAVVVIVTTHPHPGEEYCTLVGAPRTATVDLAAPLGDRTVLEVQQGTPVPVTITT